MVLENGVWTQETSDATHKSSKVLGDFLTAVLPKNVPVYDFGCGNGYYCSRLDDAGFFAIGVEGYPLNNHLNKNFVVHDLTKPLNMGIPGTVISLEVGEHLPKEAQETFMQTVTGNCNGILVFSWAEIGQPGLGHINCRDQQEVIADVCSRGFRCEKELTERIRPLIEEETSWFQRTLLIFTRL